MNQHDTDAPAVLARLIDADIERIAEAVARRLRLGATAPTPDKQPIAMLPAVQQAGMMCANGEFQAWLHVADADEAARKVRDYCGIVSRKELATNERAARMWDNLLSQFLAQQQAPVKL